MYVALQKIHSKEPHLRTEAEQTHYASFITDYDKFNVDMNALCDIIASKESIKILNVTEGSLPMTDSEYKYYLK